MNEADVLARLVERYSPSGAEGPAVREFQRIATTLGYRARIDAAGNGVAIRGSGRPELLFLGHIDTVEGNRPVKWRAGTLSGRGAVDAKGALAAALMAGGEFHGPGSYRIVAAVGEETDSRGARHVARGRAPDFVIAGEPSGWDGLTIGYRGDLRLQATFRRGRSHYAGPSPTAGDLAVAWVTELRRSAVGPSDASPFRSLSCKVVGLDGDFRGDEETVRITVDLRIPPGRSTREVLAALRVEPRPRRLEELVRIEPWEAHRTNRVVRELSAAIRRQGRTPTLWRKTGTSDLNLVGPRWNVPAAAYGPGDARLDHTDREALSLGELRRAARVLRETLDGLTGGGAALTLPVSADGA